MAINTEIYGAANKWLESLYLSTGAMKAKCANFTGGSTLSGSALSAGNTAGKTPHNELIDRSISLTALGTESLYSHICYVNDGDTYVDNELVTEFFFAEKYYQSEGSNVEQGESYIYNAMPYNQWKTYNSASGTYTNYSDNTIPIVELNPRKILYILQVLPCKADGTIKVNAQNQPDWTFFGSYDRNNANIRTTYPYVMAARLNPRIDNSTTTTPTRTTLTDVSAYFGVAINREFTALPDDNIKINYAIFRSMMLNNILIYGTVDKQLRDSDFYNLILADGNDLQYDGSHVWAQHEYTAEFGEFLKRQAACFGVYFRVSDQGDAAGDWRTIELNSAGICLGLLDEQGIGHGDYTQGAENENNPIYNWNSYSESPYDYTKPVDPTQYNDTTVFGDNTLSTTFVQYYAMNKTGLESLCTYIYNYINSIDTDVEDINKAITKTFYTNNPLDTILSLKMFPFSITDLVGGVPQNVVLGHLSTGGAGTKLNGNYTVVDLGSYECFPYFGDCFLDYSPFTYYELIVPFCGSTRLDPAQFMGKTLKLKMAIDLYTGACTCYILANNLCIDSLSGNCAVDMAITGIQSADFQNSVQNAITNVKNARISQKAWEMRGGLAMGAIWRGNTHAILGSGKFSGLGNILADLGGSFNPLSLGSNLVNSQKTEAQNAIDVNQAEYNLQHLTTPFSAVGSQSAANSRMEEMQARLIIYRPIIAPDFNAEIYADTYGYATLENDTLEKYSGLTVAKVNLSGLKCSEEEKQMIENLFAQGVYI